MTELEPDGVMSPFDCDSEKLKGMPFTFPNDDVANAAFTGHSLHSICALLGLCT